MDLFESERERKGFLLLLKIVGVLGAILMILTFIFVLKQIGGVKPC